MKKESIDNLVKRVLGEICEKDKSISISVPFSIAVYDPQKTRSEGVIKTCDSLKNAIHCLYMLLEKEPTSTGEIFSYRRRRINIVYTKSPYQ